VTHRWDGGMVASVELQVVASAGQPDGTREDMQGGRAKALVIGE